MWNVFCAMIVLTCFLKRGCVRIGFLCVSVLVICVLVFAVFFVVCTVFFIVSFMYILFVLSVLV